MSPLSELAKAAFVTTSKGAGVTLASTVASCYLACQIEVHAHRFIYSHWPEKYATVEHANGLTHEELERAHQLSKPTTTMAQPDNVLLADDKPTVGESSTMSRTSPVYSFDLSSSTTLDQQNQFWKEAEEPMAAIQGFTMSQRDIIATSMTS
ncbi:MAG: hypothetical protein SGBAC_005380 [Bacillariaceae sp.]